MKETNKKIVSILNDLIETCEDGAQGFKTAAEGLEDTEIKALFNQYADEREVMAAELQSQVELFDEEPATTGSVAGAVHRGWINMKSAVTGKDLGAIISEAERGEDTAKEAYEQALKEDLPSNIRNVIDRQYRRVLEAHNRVRSLELAYSK